MKYNLSNTEDLSNFKYKVDYLIQNKKIVELKQLKPTRSSKQNRALHKYFEIISEELNELGIEHQYQGITGKTLSTMYTPDLVKNFVWRPIQTALFDIESTTKIGTQEIDKIIDVITKFFSDRGVYLPFPSIETLMENF